MTFDGDWRPRRAEDAAWNEVDGEVVVAQASRGTICGLSETGAEIWRMCDGQLSVSQMALRLQEQFDVEPAQIERDLVQFLESMIDQALVQPPEPRR